jgi:hypothetical protein
MKNLSLLALVQLAAIPSAFALDMPAIRGHISVANVQAAPELRVNISFDELTSCSDDSIAGETASVDANGNFELPALNIPAFSGTLDVSLSVTDVKQNTTAPLAAKDSLSDADVKSLPANFGHDYTLQQTRLNQPTWITVKWTAGLTLDQYVKALVAAHPDLANALKGVKGKITYTIADHDFIGSRVGGYSSLTWLTNPSLSNNGDLANDTMGSLRQLDMNFFATPSYVYVNPNDPTISRVQYLTSVPDGDRAGGEILEPMLLTFVAVLGANDFQQLATVEVGAIRNRMLSIEQPNQTEIHFADPRDTRVRSLEKMFFSRVK